MKIIKAIEEEEKKGKEKEKEKENTNIFKENDENSKCFKFINDKMSLALSKYYVEKKFSENIKTETMNMIENIRNAMIYRIKELEWLDESTREYAIKKVINIKYFIGHFDYIMNSENLYNQYKFYEPIQDDDPMSLLLVSLNASNNNSLQSIYNENYNEIEEQAQYIIENIMSTYEVNAFYGDNNFMIFPAAILQSPNIDINQPDYINYGNIGSTIGHELTHAFDNTGKNYDAEGKEINWWTDNDSEEFDEFSQCFIDQYDNYSFILRGIKSNVDGERTLDENLADNGGLNRAYEAWKLSIENNPEKAKERNKLLPGLSNYTMDQLFYISFAHSFCEVDIIDTANENEHSPGKFRVNGSYNFEESRNYLKLNLEFPEYTKGFRWILKARCGYKIDARVAKAAKMINNSCPNCCSCYFHCESYQRINHWFINCFLFKNLRFDHFSDLDRNFFYFLDSLFNSLVRTSNNSSVDNRINNIVKGYKSSNSIRINSISNIDILEIMVLVIELTIVHKKRNGNVCLSVRLNLVHIQNPHSCCDLRLY
ncbi:zincin [Anaeromyces robustus]|uniref:Zincin n=1 Tax=Anaeromyces robustus TaxID=1754192 RepID=A0A1Y1VQ32_9FUNG|nr:zincin [Anaeromyces robustus]|eukprot:ORX63408.1 zincin [Anaeromyces robustus]